MPSSSASAHTPLVSIYIPTRNRALLLDRALASVSNQTYTNIEVLVCDDGSIQDLSHIREKYTESIQRLRWFRNETPQGACAARNRMIFSATGEFLTGLDDDDTFELNRIEYFLDHWEPARYSFLCTPYTLMGKNFKRTISRGAKPIGLESMKNGNSVGNQLFTTTASLREIGGFDPSFPSWQDYDTWIRLILAKGPGLKLKNATYNLYHHQNERISITQSPSSNAGRQAFVTKHSAILSKSNILSLYYYDLMNRGARAPLPELLKNLSPGSSNAFLKYWIKTYLLSKEG